MLEKHHKDEEVEHLRIGGLRSSNLVPSSDHDSHQSSRVDYRIRVEGLHELQVGFDQQDELLSEPEHEDAVEQDCSHVQVLQHLIVSTQVKLLKDVLSDHAVEMDVSLHSHGASIENQDHQTEDGAHEAVQCRRLQQYELL